MRLNLVNHLQIQRKTIGKVLIHGLEAGALCFFALWLTFDNLPSHIKILLSLVFALAVIVIGVVSSIFISKKTLANFPLSDSNKSE